MVTRNSIVAGLCAAWLLAIAPAAAQPLERKAVTIAIGTWTFAYLPLVIAQAQGLFRDEGIDVTMQNFNAGGSRAVQALIGGSTDLVVGYYDHTIQMQAQQKYIRCVVLLDRLAGPVLAIRNDLLPKIHDPADLKGRHLGVSSLGSSTEFQLRYLLNRAGLGPDDYTVAAVGTDASAVAAVEHRQVDALVIGDPAVSLLQRRGLVTPLVDSRTDAGSRIAFGGPYPTACLYAMQPFIDANPGTVQHLVRGFVRALRWIHAHTPEEVARATPEEYELNDPALFRDIVARSADVFSATGRLDPEDAARVLSIFESFDPRIAAAHIDLSRTYTNTFVNAVDP